MKDYAVILIKEKVPPIRYLSKLLRDNISNNLVKVVQYIFNQDYLVYTGLLDEYSKYRTFSDASVKFVVTNLLNFIKTNIATIKIRYISCDYVIIESTCDCHVNMADAMIYYSSHKNDIMYSRVSNGFNIPNEDLRKNIKSDPICLTQFLNNEEVECLADTVLEYIRKDILARFKKQKNKKKESI